VRHERVLELEPIDAPRLERLCGELRAGDALALTSRRAVARLPLSGCLRPPDGVIVAAVGPATAAALESAGLHVDFVGPGGARELAGALPVASGARVLFPCAEGAGLDLDRGLGARGITVDRVPVYRTVTAREPDPEAPADARVWMSPSAQRASGELGRAARGARGPGLLFSETEALVAQLAVLLPAARDGRALEPTP
jgi:uroporphyrinogen-III synthase